MYICIVKTINILNLIYVCILKQIGTNLSDFLQLKYFCEQYILSTTLSQIMRAEKRDCYGSLEISSHVPQYVRGVSFRSKLKNLTG